MLFPLRPYSAIIVLAAMLVGCAGNSTTDKHNQDSANAAAHQPSDLTSGKGHYAYNPDSASARHNNTPEIKDSLKNADANKR